jgi:anti-sigma factor RsiW
MTCKQLVETLEQYLAGELGADVRETLESHLTTCTNCRRYLESYQNTVRLAKHADDAPPAEVPEGLVQAILSARSRSKR